MYTGIEFDSLLHLPLPIDLALLGASRLAAVLRIRIGVKLRDFRYAPRRKRFVHGFIDHRVREVASLPLMARDSRSTAIDPAKGQRIDLLGCHRSHRSA